MYSVGGYGMMIADRARVAAYSQALERSITPGCTVLDIGTGTGFFAMLACRLGAGKVYAVEPDDVIGLARIAARDNGFADRIDFIQDLSTRIELPEQVDVVVSDLRTVLPWFQGHIEAIADARSRLLRPGGALIPQQDRVSAAIVEMPEFHAQLVGHQPGDTLGFDMSAARRAGANAWSKARVAPEQLLTDARRWATIDYRRTTDPGASATIEWTVERDGLGHGIAAWFDTTLVDGIAFFNAPGEVPKLYGQAFFPWPHAVELRRGDHVAVDLGAIPLEGNYIWHWRSTVTAAADGQILASFAQNDFRPPSKRNVLGARAASAVPDLNGRERIDRFILDRLDGSTTLGEMAKAVAARFPDEFASWEEALGTVADLSARYAR